MTQEQQAEAFRKELEALINRFVDEYDLTYETLIGSLHITLSLISSQCIYDEYGIGEEDTEQ